MKRYRTAAILQIIHGGLMEIGGVLFLISALTFGFSNSNAGQYFEFKLQYFQDNLYMMSVMSLIYGILRIIGAVGLLKTECGGDWYCLLLIL